MLEQNAKVPFSKGLGTLVAERVVDAVLLGLIVVAGVLVSWNEFTLLLTPDADMAAPAAQSIPLLKSSKFWFWTIGIIMFIAVCWWACVKFHLWDKVKNSIFFRYVISDGLQQQIPPETTEQRAQSAE